MNTWGKKRQEISAEKQTIIKKKKKEIQELENTNKTEWTSLTVEQTQKSVTLMIE